MIIFCQPNQIRRRQRKTMHAIFPRFFFDLISSILINHRLRRFERIFWSLNQTCIAQQWTNICRSCWVDAGEYASHTLFTELYSELFNLDTGDVNRLPNAKITKPTNIHYELVQGQGDYAMRRHLVSRVNWKYAVIAGGGSHRTLKSFIFILWPKRNIY